MALAVTFDTWVAPLAGAWIEMSTPWNGTGPILVAPLAGAWIEIENYGTRLHRPLRVAPLAGAWIEMPPCTSSTQVWQRRTPRGCVD